MNTTTTATPAGEIDLAEREQEQAIDDIQTRIAMVRLEADQSINRFEQVVRWGDHGLYETGQDANDARRAAGAEIGAAKQPLRQLFADLRRARTNLANYREKRDRARGLAAYPPQSLNRWVS